MAQSSNPIPEMLDKIPPEGIILSLLLTEEFRTIIARCTKKLVSNSYVVMLLCHLNDNDVITVEDLVFPGVSGTMYILRKNEYVTQ